MQHRRPGSDPWVRKITCRRKWPSTPVFLSGKSHGQRSLAAYSPWCHKESDTTEPLNNINHKVFLISLQIPWVMLLLLLSHFSRVRLLATPWTAAYQTPPSMGFSRQEYWSGVPLPSPPWVMLLLLLSHFSRVRLLATPWTAAYQTPPSMGFSRQEYWSGVPLPSPAKESKYLQTFGFFV